MTSPRVRALSLALPLLLVPGVLTGCSADSDGSSTAATDVVPVVASFYPVQWLAESIGADAVDVTSLTPAGTEPHDLAVDASGLKALDAATSVLYLGADFQPDVEQAIANLDDPSKAVDLLDADGIELIDAGDIGKETLTGGKDPHVWLDPVLMAAMAQQVTEVLAEAAPSNAEAIRERGAQVRTDLEELDGRFTASLAPCEGDTLVTSHAAFGYLADRYALTQAPIAGISPDDEPDARTLREIAVTAEQAGVRTVFFEDALPDDLARTVAEQIGAEIDLLAALEFDPRESVAPDATFITVMDDNREALSAGLVCGR